MILAHQLSARNSTLERIRFSRVRPQPKPARQAWRILRSGGWSLLTLTCTLLASPENHSAWVYPGPDGKLVYKLTPTGDRIMDFSYAGYEGGGVALPLVPVATTVQPSGGIDDTATIQTAIDRVSKLPLKNGFRGAVLLAPGTFPCAGTITVSVSGVVLRGSGSGPGVSQSTIQLTGRPHLAVMVHVPGAKSGDNSSDENPSDSSSEDPSRSAVPTKLADSYVPSGAQSINVVSASGIAVGDTVAIRRPVTAAWVRFMGMDDLVREGKAQTWIKVGAATTTERRVTAVAGNRLTLDVPLSDSFDAKYLNPPGTTVTKIKPPARVVHVGVEDLHIESPRQEINHTEAHFTALRLNGENCWARDLVIDETMNSVAVGGRRITLERVTVNRRARHQGSSKPAEFAPNASEVLLDRCAVNADNVWFMATGGGQSGPIVVLNGTFRGNSRAEAHQRWSTGMLYDNCSAPDGGIEVRNRGEMGSGHGWAMAWGVIWNCVANDYLVQNPPGAYNWLIGSRGRREFASRPWGSGPNLPEGIVDSPGVSVFPRSLYLTQLAERLGVQALENIGYSAADLTPKDLPAHPTPAPPAAGARPNSNDGLGPNLALDRPVLTSNTRGGLRQFAGWQALDEDEKTYWATDDGAVPATLEFDTEGALDINAIVLEEADERRGRVQAYQIEGFVDGSWKLLASGTSIGEHKLEHFPTEHLWKIKLTILKADGYPGIRKLGIYHAGK